MPDTGDRGLLQDLEEMVRHLMSQERDVDVVQAVRHAVMELDHIQVAMESVCYMYQQMNIIIHVHVYTYIQSVIYIASFFICRISLCMWRERVGGREGGREKGREGEREGRREGVREGGRERRRREGVREGGREGEKEGGREGVREGGRERRKEGGRKN